MSFPYNPYKRLELVQVGSRLTAYKILCAVCQREFPRDALYSVRTPIGEAFREMGLHVQWGHDISRAEADVRWRNYG